jgi:predicted nucleotidyltransferase
MEKANAFLSDFVSQLNSRAPFLVDYILLGGSAARGDFRIGRSDMDLIVVVKKDGDAKAVKDAAFPLFWELDKKHGLQLREAQNQKLAERIIPARPSVPEGYPPFMVVAPSSPKAGKMDLFSKLDPIHGFSKSLGQSGRMSMKLIYGKRPERAGSQANHRNATPGFITYDLLSAIAMAPIAVISPTRAYNRSIRAVFFSFESDIVRGIPLPLFVREALYVKKHFPQAGSSVSYPEKVLFCLAAPIHIIIHNLRRR